LPEIGSDVGQVCCTGLSRYGSIPKLAAYGVTAPDPGRPGSNES
jgi:hypothetical protein